MLRDKLFTTGAAEVAAWCVGRRIGTIEIVDATWTTGPDDYDRRAIFFDLTLAKWPEGESLWPMEDVWALYDAVDEQAEELLWARHWYVRLRSTDPEPMDDEDDPPDDEEP